MAQKPSYEELERRLKQLEVNHGGLTQNHTTGGAAGHLDDFFHRIDKNQVDYALSRQRDFLSSLLDWLNLGITVWDADGRLVMINKGFSELTGYTLEDIQDLDGWFPKAYPDPEYRRHVQADWNLSRKSTDAVRVFKVTCKNGSVKAVEFRGAFLPDGRALVTLADITEREHAREENLKRQKFLESVLYHAPDAIVTLDSTHRVIAWNRGAVSMFGYAAEETIGIQLDDLVARGEQHKEAGQKTRQVLSGQRVEAFETVRFRKDGTPLRVIAAGSPIMVDGILMGVVAVYTDITDRVRAEEALKESEEKFRTLVEKSPLGIALISRKGDYRYINPEFEKMFGYIIADIPNGATWFRKAFPDEAYRDGVIQTWIADLKKAPLGRSRARQFTVTCKNGSRKEILFWPVTMENKDRLVICEDISEKAELELQFQQAQKFQAIGTLAGGIAHDFNNLLMGIQGRTSLMKMELTPSHPHMEHLEAMEEYVRSSTSLTRQLLGFARGGKYEVKATDINELLTASATMFARTKKEIRVHINTTAQPLVVEVDRGQIEQVFLNLFVNAWQAMPEGGDLYLETGSETLNEALCSPHQLAPGDYTRVSIADTGIGMDEETRLRIFDPFFTTKEKYRGTGLGLASAYGIINNHGGFITVESEKGYGAAFKIYLPLSKQILMSEAPLAGQLIKGSETILLVDDEEMILAVGQSMLQKLGYQVITANNGQKAIQVLEERGDHIALVILDLIMPGMDGSKTFDCIRKIRPQIRVLLSSGYSINDQANRILARGCNGFIQKPFDLMELSEKLFQLLNN